MTKLEIVISGIGGQGIIKATIILAKAAIIDGYYVSQSQSYGPEARGGASKAELIISDSEIIYPKVQSPDICLVMSQKAADIFAPKMKENSLMIIDKSLVEIIPQSKAKFVKVPFKKMALDSLNNALTANTIALGALAHISYMVDYASLAKALREEFPKIEELSLKALSLGWDSVNNLSWL